MFSVGNLSSPKTGHTTGGSCRYGAKRTAVRGNARQKKIPIFRSPWKPTASLTLQRKQAQTNKILCKTLRKQNVPLTTDLSPVYPRFIAGTASALRCWLLTSVLTPICRCKRFSWKVCPVNNLALPRLAAAPGAQTRPARGVFGFCIRQVRRVLPPFCCYFSVELFVEIPFCCDPV